MGEAIFTSPGEGAFTTRFIVAELEAVELPAGFVPDDEVEIVIGHPAPTQIGGDWLDGGVNEHGSVSVGVRGVLVVRDAFLKKAQVEHRLSPRLRVGCRLFGRFGRARTEEMTM